ncbi:unnamed protein product [Amoebophrya sp. A120]|nr:unnamed protein product [Amoebophrya sp. A120]|eukprot:GSA120T00020106001.1
MNNQPSTSRPSTRPSGGTSFHNSTGNPADVLEQHRAFKEKLRSSDYADIFKSRGIALSPKKERVPAAFSITNKSKLLAGGAALRMASSTTGEKMKSSGRCTNAPVRTTRAEQVDPEQEEPAMDNSNPAFVFTTAKVASDCAVSSRPRADDQKPPHVNVTVVPAAGNKRASPVSSSSSTTSSTGGNIKAGSFATSSSSSSSSAAAGGASTSTAKRKTTGLNQHPRPVPASSPSGIPHPPVMSIQEFIDEEQQEQNIPIDSDELDAKALLEQFRLREEQRAQEVIHDKLKNFFRERKDGSGQTPAPHYASGVKVKTTIETTSKRGSATESASSSSCASASSAGAAPAPGEEGPRVVSSSTSKGPVSSQEVVDDLVLSPSTNSSHEIVENYFKGPGSTESSNKSLNKSNPAKASPEWTPKMKKGLNSGAIVGRKLPIGVQPYESPTKEVHGVGNSKSSSSSSTPSHSLQLLHAPPIVRINPPPRTKAVGSPEARRWKTRNGPSNTTAAASNTLRACTSPSSSKGTSNSSPSSVGSKSKRSNMLNTAKASYNSTSNKASSGGHDKDISNSRLSNPRNKNPRASPTKEKFCIVAPKNGYGGSPPPGFKKKRSSGGGNTSSRPPSESPPRKTQPVPMADTSTPAEDHESEERTKAPGDNVQPVVSAETTPLSRELHLDLDGHQEPDAPSGAVEQDEIRQELQRHEGETQDQQETDVAVETSPSVEVADSVATSVEAKIKTKQEHITENRIEDEDDLHFEDASESLSPEPSTPESDSNIVPKKFTPSDDLAATFSAKPRVLEPELEEVQQNNSREGSSVASDISAEDCAVIEEGGAAGTTQDAKGFRSADAVGPQEQEEKGKPLEPHDPACSSSEVSAPLFSDATSAAEDETSAPASSSTVPVDAPSSSAGGKQAPSGASTSAQLSSVTAPTSTSTDTADETISTDQQPVEQLPDELQQIEAEAEPYDGPGLSKRLQEQMANPVLKEEETLLHSLRTEESQARSVQSYRVAIPKGSKPGTQCAFKGKLGRRIVFTVPEDPDTKYVTLHVPHLQRPSSEIRRSWSTFLKSPMRKQDEAATAVITQHRQDIYLQMRSNFGGGPVNLPVVPEGETEGSEPDAVEEAGG